MALALYVMDVRDISSQPNVCPAAAGRCLNTDDVQISSIIRRHDKEGEE